MTLARRISILGFAGATLLACPFVHASEPATLTQAEAAYAAVDFEGTRALSRAALDAGGNEPADTLRLYTLLGIAASALGEEEAAREAFRRVVAIDPALRLDKTLSPKIRSPYLEIRGQLMTRGDIAPLAANLLRSGDELKLKLEDPAGIAHVIEVSYRADHGQAFESVEVAPTETSVGQKPPNATRVEYSVVIRDEHGNALYRRGSEQEPLVLALVARDYGIDARSTKEQPSGGSYYLTAGLLATAGVALAATGGYFHVRREALAREWNGASCERPGNTRGSQCASVDERRSTAEHLAIGFYAGGGALLVGSVVTLLLVPSPSEQGAPRRAALPCVPGAWPLGMSCTASF